MDKRLAKRIYKFLDRYAVIKADYDPDFEDDAEKYASPDASALRSCADMLAEGLQPVSCWSEWGSGGYQPYNSTEGRREHDELVAKLQELGK